MSGYVIAGYAVVLGSLAAYALHVRLRIRSLERARPRAEDR